MPMEKLSLDVGARMERPGILLADDHMLVWQAYKKYLEPEFEVVGAVSDAGQLTSVASSLKPSVIILEISAPAANGVASGVELKKLLPRTKLIALSTNDDPEVAREAMQLWASAYVLKSADRSELIHAIREVLRGRSYLTPKVARAPQSKSLRNARSNHQRKLTTRQREVLQLLAEGHTMRETADTLHVTPRTVAFHKYRIMEEFGLQTNSDLVRFAIRERVISAL
jgi:DNA-binding NarL/FixJ family response regulator